MEEWSFIDGADLKEVQLPMGMSLAEDVIGKPTDVAKQLIEENNPNIKVEVNLIFDQYPFYHGEHFLRILIDESGKVVDLMNR
jgi:hypothetical protein